MKKYLVLRLFLLKVSILIFSFAPFRALANEQDIQKLIVERTQLESINSELQSEIRSSGNEIDRANEKIIILQDEIKEIKRKLLETKSQRDHFLTEAGSKKSKSAIELNRDQLLAGIAHYENFVKTGLPWDLDQRLEKITAIKNSIQSSKAATIESTLQWSQFLEAERKLASETQRKLRRLSIEGAEHDAAIFRLGLTTLYYKTSNGQTGIYYRKNQRLFHQQISDEKIKNKIVHLVESKDNKNADRILSELVLSPGMVN